MGVTQDDTLTGQSIDNYFAALSDATRRAVVSILTGEDRPVTLSSLARWVTAEREGVSLDELTDWDVERVAVELHHNHLPTLDAVGILEYCSENHHVVPTEGLKTAERFV